MPFYGKNGQPIILRPPTFDLTKMDIPIMKEKDKTLAFSNGSETFTDQTWLLFFFCYIGFLKNGERHGKGVLLYFRRSHHIPKYSRDIYRGRYEGTWNNGVPQGTGIFYDKDGKVNLQGIFNENDLYTAYGINFKYEGSYLDGKRNGFGSLTRTFGGLEYRGQWKNNMYHGKGTLYKYFGRKKYEGEFLEGKFHGNGTSYYDHSLEAYGMKNPKKNQGTWKHGKFIKGKTFHLISDDSSELEYYGEGYYKEKEVFVRHGSGSSYSNDKILYEGHWMHDRQDGLGKSFHDNGRMKYDGQWKGGKWDNFGKLYDTNGALLYDGQ